LNLAGCHEEIKKSLFLVGEIGGNDFNHALFTRKNIVEVKTYVPYVINAISSITKVRFQSSLSKLL